MSCDGREAVSLLPWELLGARSAVADEPPLGSVGAALSVCGTAAEIAFFEARAIVSVFPTPTAELAVGFSGTGEGVPFTGNGGAAALAVCERTKGTAASAGIATVSPLAGCAVESTGMLAAPASGAGFCGTAFVSIPGNGLGVPVLAVVAID